MSTRPLTLMAVHAHPDDEATGTGGVLARYSAEGIRTVVVTCTDGRCGDGPGGVKLGQPGHDAAQVVAARQAELEASCAVLGVDSLELLGYADSGMTGWPSNDAPGSFWSTPVEEAAARLAELIRRYQPDVVVTYDENGFYGHPDHVQAHRVTMAAVATTGSVAKVYWTTAPSSFMESFAEMAAAGGITFDEPEQEMPEIGLPDEEITTWVDVSAEVGRKRRALAAHSSQEDAAFFLRIPEDMFARAMGTEHFLRVHDTTGAPLPEDDLFAGLRPAPADQG
ncbi:GlcNAc-PI de-N-acetylase [Modestobacter sp. I12A-02628]|uniref:GlcNAc-PI de-N-acetylase n=1 Tax=Goekera deserti TaxID=2497753 RepID=A0A7K3WDQ3_9ACTN|nr:PIG-L family deacetylase [Goekera deserti]MPQ99532.1 GlcNAc-PI de-N-acetylase [Goekera deserti]NDI46456.1 GlcNAc-PI de-N-acetylase [Goekera deserti]NEL54611.1 GlcNAc-PI de-N-acetylase [Goekera deserti]